MPRADFYLIDKPRFREEPLLLVCELARKALAAKQFTLVLARDFAQAEALDDLLWSFDDDAFIPHQLAGDDDDADTAVLIAPPDFDRVLEVVAADSAEREGSRKRWTEYKRLGFEVAKHDM